MTTPTTPDEPVSTGDALVAAAAHHVAAAIARAVPDAGDDAQHAAELAVRALAAGSVCVDLTEPRPDGPSDGDAWRAALACSPAVTVRDPDTGACVGGHDADRPDADGVRQLRPLVLAGDRVYLEKYWRQERIVGDALLRLAETAHTADGASHERRPPGDDTLDPLLDRLFGPVQPGATEPDRQRTAAATALTGSLTVIAGGPGTGKTYTVARLLAAAAELATAQGVPLDVGLAAPTGKAAARMTEALRDALDTLVIDPESRATLDRAEARTLHRLLGANATGQFRHHHGNPLPHDLLVIDETSMVSLPLMARLLDAMAPDARLVLVGDPFQLASVDAGAVLADIAGPVPRGHRAVGPLSASTVALTRIHRFGEQSGIAGLADAIRRGAPDETLEILRHGGVDGDVRWVDPADTDALERCRRDAVAASTAMVRAALDGDAVSALDHAKAVKVLCSTRFSDQGSFAWGNLIERRLTRAVAGLSTRARWYAGRPVIVTRNDPLAGVVNGDTGVVIGDGTSIAVALDGAVEPRRIAPARLAHVESWWAMTIHKSQGSEFTHAIVSLADAGARVLTNELLYTGVTRARERVTVVGSEAAIRQAVTTPITRATGLGERLWR